MTSATGRGTPAPTPDDGGDAERRRAAALAGHEGNEAAARAFLTDSSPAVRSTALGALARLARLEPGDLMAALADSDPHLRRRACELASPLPVELTSYLDDPDAMVVEAAAWALGERGTEAGGEAVAALAATATGHDEPLCREAAVAALGAIGDPAGLPAILAATSDKPAIRRRAVLALAPFEGPEVDAAIETAPAPTATGKQDKPPKT